MSFPSRLLLDTLWSLSSLCSVSLQARLFNSEGKVTKLFSDAGDSLNLPTLNQTPFRLTVRKDVAVAIIAALLHSGKLTVLLDYVVSLSMEQSLKPALLHHGDFLNQRGCKVPLPKQEPPFRINLHTSSNGELTPSLNRACL